MNCEQAIERHAMRLAGESAGDDLELRAHLDSCAACRETTAAYALMWEDLGELPDATPGPLLQARFDAMLEAYRHGTRAAQDHQVGWGTRFGAWLESWWPRRPAMQLGMSLALLVVGVGLGAGLQGRRLQIDALRHEVQSTRAMVALSLLQQRSPADRLQGVAWSARLEDSNPQVLEALLATLDDDPSVNVRLAAVDALSSMHESIRVREGLVARLPRQTSPMVQIAVIDALVQLQESNAMDAIRKLADDSHADPAVRERARWAMQKLTS
jgi:hypothetical protein